MEQQLSQHATLTANNDSQIGELDLLQHKQRQCM